jgi:hypothetical protein
LLGAMLEEVDRGLLAVPYHFEAGIEVGKHGSGWLTTPSLYLTDHGLLRSPCNGPRGPCGPPAQARS